MSAEREQHVVRITKNLGEERRDKVVAFIDKRLAAYKGTLGGEASEGTHGIPLLVFQTSKDAHLFASELARVTDYPREHIEIKPRDSHTATGRRDGKT
jgi:hypothetical protein